MNILFTSDLSGMGGGETSLVNLCDVLRENNKVVVVCAVDGKLVSILRNKGIKTYVLDYRNKKKLFLNFLKIRHLIKDEQIDVIHSNDPLTSVIMYYASVGKNISTYWTCHGQWYNFKGLRRWLIKHSNKHIFCVSTKVRDSLVKMGFTKMSVTYLGIPLNKYANAESSNLRKEFKIESNAILLGCIGRFQPIKGQMKLVEAVKQLIRKNYNIVCVFIGGCIYNNKEEKEYYEMVKTRVEQEGLEKNIFFAGERRNIENILKELNILVVPSDNESFGMMAVEALAAGTPVLSTPNDGVSEILEYKQEYISKSNDAEGIEKLIENFLSEKKNNSLAKIFCQQRQKDFDVNIIAEKYLNIFKKG